MSLTNAISEFRREMLRIDPDFLKNLIIESSAAIVVDIESGTILYATPPADKMFGYIQGALETMNITDLMPERFRATHGEHTKRFMDNPNSRPMGLSSMDLVGRKKDGAEFKIEIGLVPRAKQGKNLVVATINERRN